VRPKGADAPMNQSRKCTTRHGRDDSDRVSPTRPTGLAVCVPGLRMLLLASGSNQRL
jgi:hypothetical protein